ncbi:aspartate--tRNA ligase [Blattabacterium cuenoti]|uniref:aspartate--tRNA ligase n=1 Tax=Blattabacterium cuenoti TaxID=1653831 RepID=UPI00163C3B01|nr:aspartate--tRNA ligase [Blattabacterium cuenoti]
MYRTHNCRELCKKNIGDQVILSGWINQIRNLGSLFFIDIRDYFGITQLIIDKNKIKENLGKEFLIKIEGKVVERYSKNYDLHTGSIEVIVSKIKILNKSIPLPFNINKKEIDGKEEDRMTYRYLDIRRSSIKENLIFRHNIVLKIRNFLSNNNFIEIETPMLINHTPEGARSFFVPSRKYQNKFYSLPQSPQMFKQLLMIGGIDRYFQIVKCFRDEDSRSDRQIEFTQIDCEMAFVEIEGILKFFEKFIHYIFYINNIKLLNKKFTVIPYKESIKKYGTESPDIRYGMEFCNLNSLIYKENIHSLVENELIIGIKLENFNETIYKKIDFLIKEIKNDNIFCIKYLSDKKISIINNKENINIKHLYIISKFFEIKTMSYIFISYGKKHLARFILNKIRNRIIKIIDIKNNKKIYSPVWITDHPILKWKKKQKIYKSMHHPFTSPKEEDIHLLKTNPEKVRSKSYDLIINGIEIASGSIRIHKKNIQNIIFKHLGFSYKKINSIFGFFTKALEYGAPPHGGIAFGLDRLITLLRNSDNIKNFIAFPKNNSGKDLMTNAPSKKIE